MLSSVTLTYCWVLMLPVGLLLLLHNSTQCPRVTQNLCVLLRIAMQSAMYATSVLSVCLSQTHTTDTNTCTASVLLFSLLTNAHSALEAFATMRRMNLPLTLTLTFVINQLSFLSYIL